MPQTDRQNSLPSIVHQLFLLQSLPGYHPAYSSFVPHQLSVISGCTNEKVTLKDYVVNSLNRSHLSLSEFYGIFNRTGFKNFQ